MSDTTEAVLKLITSITSTKGAIKFLSISLSLVTLWKYTSNYIESIGVPNEHKALAILFAAIGIGSITGKILNYAIDMTYNATWKKYLNSRDKKKLLLEQESLYRETLEIFLQTYKHYSYTTKEALWKLLDEPQPLWDEHDSNIPIASLIECNFIRFCTRINENEGIYELHPHITAHLRNSLQSEIKNIVNEYLTDKRIDNALLTLITTKEHTPDIPYQQLSRLLNNAYPILSSMVHEHYYDDGFEVRKEIFTIHTNRFFEKELSKQLDMDIYKHKYEIQSGRLIAYEDDDFDE
ncbi:hypothetical protein [Aeromonas sp. MdU4]|uniref:hypothetical protein n=1 Tax=Aeromonas sp. MdU4 TaxID=3342819 RepID=UPI0035BB8C5B